MTYQLCLDKLDLSDTIQFDEIKKNILHPTKIQLQYFWDKFSHEYDIRDARVFYISGGIIANLINYYWELYVEDTSISMHRRSGIMANAEKFYMLDANRFRRFVNDPKSDVDIYMNVDDKEKVILPDRLKRKLVTNAKTMYKGKNCWHINHESHLTDVAQIIHTTFGSPRDVVNTFDMFHSKAYYTCHDETLHITKKQLYAILRKEIILTGKTGLNTTPNKTQERIEKWKQRGYTDAIDKAVARSQARAW